MIGHSYGSAIIQSYNILYPKTIYKTVLLEPVLYPINLPIVKKGIVVSFKSLFKKYINKSYYQIIYYLLINYIIVRSVYSQLYILYGYKIIENADNNHANQLVILMENDEYTDIPVLVNYLKSEKNNVYIIPKFSHGFSVKYLTKNSNIILDWLKLKNI